MPRTPSAIRLALAYFLGVFAVAFALGVIRTLWLAPLLGAMAAVAVELPLVLLTSWLWAGHLLRRYPLASAAAALRIGLIAFALLLGSECALAMVLFGTGPAQWLSAQATPPGALGLTGQILFALVPWARWRRSAR
ncbi:hypothetical protein [Novosphingobium sp. B 225]|uniref:hypothetical protein n=1 Tax=Novosphingobium sp. B 225 TaxID=1961849 RepID=UPI000B4B6758|nr:hypothetical protein [Novosphingobium sp. B 225]